LDWVDVAWVLSFVISTFNGSRSPYLLFEYLAPVVCSTPHEREELRVMLEEINPPSEEEAPDRLELVRRKLEKLFYEGRVLLDELPPEVRARVHRAESLAIGVRS
jgi:hypothetical protein